MIEDLRKQIDDIDEKLIPLLAKRMELSRQIGVEKQKTGEDIHVKTREIEVLDMAKILGDREGLSDQFVADLYGVIFAESRRIQGAE